MSENHMGGTEGSLCRDRLASYITVKGSRLTSLNLQANRLTDQDAAVLCEALGQNFRLTSVDLSHNALGDKAGMALAQLFQPLRCALTGQAGGPDLFEVMALLGPAASERRIERALARLA